MYWQDKVWEEVERFRLDHIDSEWASIPLDIFSIVDVNLGLDIIPFDDLRNRYNIEAALTKDYSGIYIDAETYIYLEDGPEWKLNRLRFSFAHELGHYILHKELADKQIYSSVDDFVEWQEDYGGEKENIERQADEFAGRLLVPRESLEKDIENLLDKLNSVNPFWRQDSNLRTTVASRIAQRYGVTGQVIEIRMDREGVWKNPSY